MGHLCDKGSEGLSVKCAKGAQAENSRHSVTCLAWVLQRYWPPAIRIWAGRGPLCAWMLEYFARGKTSGFTYNEFLVT